MAYYFVYISLFCRVETGEQQILCLKHGTGGLRQTDNEKMD